MSERTIPQHWLDAFANQGVVRDGEVTLSTPQEAADHLGIKLPKAEAAPAADATDDSKLKGELKKAQEALQPFQARNAEQAALIGALAPTTKEGLAGLKPEALASLGSHYKVSADTKPEGMVDAILKAQGK